MRLRFIAWIIVFSGLLLFPSDLKHASLDLGFPPQTRDIASSDGMARPPHKTESFDLIARNAQWYFGVNPRSFRKDLAFLQKMKSGTGAPYAKWQKGEWYPLALGGLSRKPGSFDEFLSRLEPHRKAYGAQRGTEVSWATYCSYDASVCSRLMHEACLATRDSPIPSPAEKVLLFLEAAGLKKLAGMKLSRKPICDPNRAWWEGYCHLTPPAMTFFTEAPPHRNYHGAELGPEEYELITRVLLDPIYFKTRGPLGGIRDNVDQRDVHETLNPASLIYMITNLLGMRDGMIPIMLDIDKGPSVWNHLLTAYRLEIGPELSRQEATAAYADLRKNVSSAWTAQSAARFRYATITLELDGSFENALGAILEFDESNQLVGGEWLQYDHPDLAVGVLQRLPSYRDRRLHLNGRTTPADETYQVLLKLMADPKKKAP